MAELFQSPADIRSAILREQLGTANAISSGSSAALVGGIFGRALQGEDPRLKQARTLEEINQELLGMGLEVGTPGFTQALVPRVRSRLGMGPALQAQQMALQAESQLAAVRGVKGPSPALVRQLGRLGYSPEEAADIAAHPEMATSVIKARMKPEALSTAGRMLVESGLTQGTPEFRAAMQEEIDKPRGVRVEINAGSKAAEVLRAKTEEAQRAESVEVDNALDEVLGAGVALSDRGVGGVLGAPVDTAVEARRYRSRAKRLAKALAQLRNPGSAEASDMAAATILEDMPGAGTALVSPKALRAFVEDFRREAAQARGEQVGGAGRSIENLTPADLRTMTAEELEALAR